ncbi:MAG: hypothetical protein BGN86_13005 [Caulobacterales bacterium 68-7]|nr:MAG: hypothetical protein BGN86_13005 [Caulobacterales bacterium 68-7]
MTPQPSKFRLTFWQAAAAGAALSLMAGLTVGNYFKTGVETFALPMSGSGGLVFSEADAAPVAYMTDASGKIPDYVLGTDFTHPRPIEPLVQVAYEPPPPPELPSFSTPSAALETVNWTPAPPPSTHGDILAGMNMAPQTQTPAEPEAQPASVVVENGAPRVIAAAY